ncbi:DNA polymerase I [Sulfurihydrogenibium azorense Az-Fu1]|jgi:DNA polymerase-1|uniref:DNA polymerase I n=1 Tax=Sulfurihydrogenibium azorense (strain DSM 15241 / OCM 825 / Az-Fu1) TaxID=204536 RepID=C1DVJ9_SULAA|nr:5'-3' exonuclease H3TH domain-containing protein [Sulfurihydrogenibium azorense]ACN98808.1 DNA polymerase I [Sulfurihydrogenibium azorense Az-Fu1]MDM7274123.1 5'-3' exonuclease H3TH domain-containing protein [Sulfurihydrogenibium azorense]
MDKKLLLVDGSSYLYRAYYALPPLSAPDGTPTGAIYGFVRMLLKLISTFNTPYIAVVFDRPEKTVRHKIYKEYKATRKETPNDLQVQIPKIKEIIKLLGIKILEIPGYEADDIIATLSKKAENRSFEVIIVTPDKDMNQLIDQHIKIFNPMKEEIVDTQKVIEKYGVSPQQFIDYLVLVGDSIDNIPGIKGVGPKTAASLLQEFGSIDRILENKDKLKGKLKESFAAVSKEDIQLVRSLVKLHQDIDIPVEIESLKKDKPDLIKLKEIFEKLGFKSLIKEIEKPNLEKKQTIVQKSLF